MSLSSVIIGLGLDAIARAQAYQHRVERGLDRLAAAQEEQRHLPKIQAIEDSTYNPGVFKLMRRRYSILLPWSWGGRHAA